MNISNGIHYYALLDGTGYGDAAANYIDGLIARDIPVKWTPLVFIKHGLIPVNLLPEEISLRLDNGTPRRQSLLALMETDLNPDLVFIHSVPELFDKLRRSSRPAVGCTVWETTQLPTHWPALLGHVDQLVVPCEMNRSTFNLAEAPPVSVVPHICNESLLDVKPEAIDQLRSALEINPGTWVYYNISSWAPRKALPQTLHSYLLAFSAADDVCLVLKTDQQGQDLTSSTGRHTGVRRMVNEIMAAYPDPAKIVLVDHYLNPDEITALHQLGDCYYSLAYSEGWGLGAFDAATVGNPVIITGWGGHLDFLHEDDAFFVQYQMEFVKPYAQWDSYSADQQWAAADIDHAISILEQVYRNRSDARVRGKRLQASILSRYTSAIVSDKMLAVFDAM